MSQRESPYQLKMINSFKVGRMCFKVLNINILNLFSCLQSLGVALLMGGLKTAPPAGRGRDLHMRLKLHDFPTPLIQQNQEQDDKFV